MANKYSLEERTYELDPSRVMDVISDLQRSISIQRITQREEFPKSPTPAVSLYGRGKKMEISGEYNRGGHITGCTLGELELSEKADSLVLRTFAEEGITIDPSDIYCIGDKYSIKK